MNDRREFIGQLATAALAVAGTACAAPLVAQSQQPSQSRTPVTPAPPPHYDDSWVARLTAKHRAVFDAPEIGDGMLVANPFVWMRGYAEMYQTTDAETQAVIVIRHAAIPLAVDDALWAKYDLGKETKTKDPETDAWARRNPYLVVAPGAKAMPPGMSLEALRARGATLLGCNMALGHLIGQIATRTNQPKDALDAEVRAHLIPGLILMPNGIFAVTRAEEAGCAYMRSA